MTALPLFFATGLYVWQAANCLASGQPAMALVFGAYALANVGLIIAVTP